MFSDKNVNLLKSTDYFNYQQNLTATQNYTHYWRLLNVWYRPTEWRKLSHFKQCKKSTIYLLNKAPWS